MIATGQPAISLPESLNTVKEFDEWQRLHVKEGSYEFVRGRGIDKGGLSQADGQIVGFLLRSFAQTKAYSLNNSLLPRLES